ncbi:hypothetical protein MQE23_33130 [Streptomyces sp. HP-A2021]|uniref:hypothetical protein n=1 Tax=Streptomyces TaxID=1883 RepID=UPI000FE2269E|nr:MULTISPECIES: hypothetical protein [Streptomyces]UOB13603.1 hypothetical protein MQE23_33130 [Streptomyces sp. HP-A2021]
MGIRTLLRGTAPGVVLPPVPPFAVAASTVRVPAGLTTVLRRTTADLRQRLADGGRPAGLTRAAVVPAATGRTGAGDVTAVPGVTGARDVSAVPGLAGAGDVSAILGLTGGPAPAAQQPGSAERRGRTGRPWADLARSYLTLVLTLLPRPRRPAHTTITVYITTTEPLSERPTGSAPRHRRGQDRPGPGPEPDATP